MSRGGSRARARVAMSEGWEGRVRGRRVAKVMVFEKLLLLFLLFLLLLILLPFIKYIL